MPTPRERPQSDQSADKTLQQPVGTPEQFQGAMRQILKVTKEQSDKQLADFQADNRRRRESKKKA